MLALLRFGLIAFAVLSVVFVSLWMYLQAGRREQAEAEWESRGRPGSQGRFVARALAQQSRVLLPRLIVFIYALPLALLTLIVYFTNQR